MTDFAYILLGTWFQPWCKLRFFFGKFYYPASDTMQRSAVYTHITDHYKPPVRIMNLVSHITYAVRINFIRKWQDLQFKIGSEEQISWGTFVFYLLLEFMTEIFFNALVDVWPEVLNVAFTSIKSTLHAILRHQF